MPRKITPTLIALPFIAVSLLVGCTSSDLPVSWAEMIEVPSSVGSTQPYLHVDEHEQLWMSWTQRVDSTQHALQYASYDGTSWSKPETIVSGSDLISLGPDIPSFLPLRDERLAAHYLVNNGPNMHGYDMHVVQTDDNGTWQEAVIPHGNRTATQHGFASLAHLETNQLLGVWLDGRETRLAEGVTDEAEWGDMTLRAAFIDSAGTVKEEILLDDRVCDCCQTSAVTTESGALIAYRGRTAEEVRDINLIQFDGESWSDPYQLHHDGWQMNGCPVNGPKLAANGSRVAAAWFTAANNSPKVKVAFSDDGGEQFSEPLVIADERPRGRVGISLLDDSSAFASWVGYHDGQSTIQVRYIEEDGSMGEVMNIVKPQSTAFTGIPQMVRRDEEIYIAWVDGGDPDETVVQLTRPSIQELK